MLLEEHVTKRVCTYCGQVEGVPAKEMASLLAKGDSGTPVKEMVWWLVDCMVCGGAAYCSQLCQAMDFERHSGLEGEEGAPQLEALLRLGVGVGGNFEDFLALADAAEFCDGDD